ncbi:MAG: hypothetical protein K0Q59_1238 [Paenibacillus sp.]|nr:hypothetical protein [Paenibacillus sp.]
MKLITGYCPSCSHKQTFTDSRHIGQRQCPKCSVHFSSFAAIHLECPQCRTKNNIALQRLDAAKCGVCKARFITVQPQPQPQPEPPAVTKPLKADTTPKSSIVSDWSERLKNLLNSISDDMAIPLDKRVHLIVHAGSLVSAIIAVQPIPFADIFILTPIQVVMVYYISRTLGLGVTETSAKELAAYVAGVVGWGVLAQQLILGAYKTVIPFLGGFTTIPLVYAATCGLGYAAKAVIEAKMNHRTVSKEEVKRTSEAARKKAKAESGFEWTPEGLKREWERLETKSKTYRHYSQSAKKIDEDLIQRADSLSEAELNRKMEEKLAVLIDRYKSFEGITVAPMTLLSLIFLNHEQRQQVDNVVATLKHRSMNQDNKHGIAPIPNIGSVYYLIEGSAIHIDMFQIDSGDRGSTSSAMKDAYTSLNNRFVYNEEIRRLMIEAIETSKHELNIISAWMNNHVVDAAMVQRFEAALKRGVTIKILYGIDDHSNGHAKQRQSDRGQRTEKVAEMLREKFQRYGYKFRMKRVNTHMKIMLSDDTFYLIGSYNFLSFSGDYEEDMRSEGAEYGTAPYRVQQLRHQHFAF